MTITKIQSALKPSEYDSKINEIIGKVNSDQCAPFSINSGSIDAWGGNNTLTYTGSVLTCAPCTITTADGRTKTFENNSVLDVSGVPETAVHSVFKRYSDGGIAACWSGWFTIGKTAPAAPSDNYLHVWLDTSQYPLTSKQYDSGTSQWVINNDLVYLGDATISDGVITAVSNSPFNWNGITGAAAAMPSNRYIDLTLGASGSTYRAPADGWYTLMKHANPLNTSIPDYKYLGLLNTANDFYSEDCKPYAMLLNVFLPVKKGDAVMANYSASGETERFRFYYAQGA